MPSNPLATSEQIAHVMAVELVSKLYIARAKLMYNLGHEWHSWMCLFIAYMEVP